MAIDPARLAAGADAHQERMTGPGWAAAAADPLDTALVGLSGPGSSSPAPTGAADLSALLEPVVARLDRLTTAVAGLHVAAEAEGQPDRLDAVVEAVGDPLAYDRPDARRVQVGVRFLPELERAVLRLREDQGLRTRVGAWEYVVRLGLTAVRRGCGGLRRATMSQGWEAASSGSGFCVTSGPPACVIG